MNTLYYGDNLHILREHLADESVDLIYLDPPFNSKRVYNVYLKSPKGHSSEAQVTAFEDSWMWGEQAEREYNELLHQPNTDVSEMIASLRRFLKESDVMAYLVMMSNRLLELHRVLKPIGSLYLHCDPTASHYLKIVMDAIFGGSQFRNEIIWRRTGSHNKIQRYGPIHDVILFYSKTENYTWTYPKRPYMLGHVEENFVKDENGFKTNYYGNVLTGSGKRSGESGKPWRGFDPTAKDRHWAIPGALLEDIDEDLSGLSQHQKLDRLLELGHIKIVEGQAWPMYERYLKSGDGQAISDIWAYQPYTEGTVFGTDEGVDADIRWLSTKDKERLGYPTQKPLTLLERIIQASSNSGDVVLDPFCGCGTAVHAAQKLGRQWIGIDITNLAISLIEKRLKDAFLDSTPPLEFKVHGTPKDLDGARDLAARDKYEFQYWACSLVDAQPYQGKKKGADTGIDGLIFFQDDKGAAKKVIVSVKGGENVGVSMLKDLIATVQREEAQIGLFVTLANPTEPMKKEAVSAGFYDSQFGAFPKIQILTIEDLLNGTEGPRYPDMARGGLNFKKAKKEKKDNQQKLFDA